MIAIKIFSIFTSGTRNTLLFKMQKDNEKYTTHPLGALLFFVEEQQDELSKSNFYVVSS